MSSNLARQIPLGIYLGLPKHFFSFDLEAEVPAEVTIHAKFEPITSGSFFYRGYWFEKRLRIF